MYAKNIFYSVTGGALILILIYIIYKKVKTNTPILPLEKYNFVQAFHAGHNGIDLGAVVGQDVYAPMDGHVSEVAYEGASGNYVKIDGDDGYRTSFSHLSVQNVTQGQRVNQGDVIGKIGVTGYTEGPHLHFVLSKLSNANVGIDPVAYFGDAISTSQRDFV